MSLIEVLVSILIFSFGLIGLVGLQTRALQFSTSAEDTNRAALLANDLGSLMVTSQSVSLPAAVLGAWQARVADPTAGGLPNGEGMVMVLGNVATVTLTWRATHLASDADNAQNQYVTQVILP